MLADKTVRYQGKNTNLDKLRADIIANLQADGFKIQETRSSPAGMLIQAQKGGFLRELITAERALDILIQGEPNNFAVRIGIGKWVQNIAVATVETLLISELFLPLDVGEMLWNVEVEKKLLKKIDDLVAMGSPAATEGIQMEQPIMEVVEKDGTTTVTSQSKIVKGRIERVTGAGHFVVYPNDKESDIVKTGDQVMVLTDMKLMLDISLQVVREPVIAPYPVSEFAIDLKGGNRQLQTCTVYCKGEQLYTIDLSGTPKYEVKLPLGGTLRFHIPDTLKPLKGALVEVREGEITIYETFDAIPGAATAIPSLEPPVTA
ncbi:MAG: hypothetical protein OK456_11135 [Thaumarchaeota archaeon]|nr:hypothetical protein [Nitrososphaerota archaeon]